VHCTALLSLEVEPSQYLSARSPAKNCAAVRPYSDLLKRTRKEEKKREQEKKSAILVFNLKTTQQQQSEVSSARSVF
jgi:ribosomal protein S25